MAQRGLRTSAFGGASNPHATTRRYSPFAKKLDEMRLHCKSLDAPGVLAR
jgi:hypothetical protein